jgi:hypothetical protein
LRFRVFVHQPLIGGFGIEELVRVQEIPESVSAVGELTLLPDAG